MNNQKTDNIRKEAQKRTQDYVDYMNKTVQAYKEDIQRWYNTDEYLQDPYMEWFNCVKALRTVRLWDIIQNELDPAQRNLLNCYYANGQKMDTMAAIFAVQYKNAATLRVLLSNARKAVREAYKAKYGDE